MYAHIMKWALGLFAVLLPLPAWPQQSTIQGIVTDKSEAAVPGARVTVINTATAISQSVVTNEQGFYSVPFLIPGTYSIKVEARGFSATTLSNVPVDVGATVRADVVLEVGKVETTVEISAAAALLNSETTIVGQVIDNRQVVELPLDSRNYLELAMLTPGAAPAEDARSSGAGAFTAAGSKAYHVNITLDGVDNASRTTGGQMGWEAQAVTPSIDALQEFRVVTNNNSAEFGFRMGGTVQVQTKSGTNQYRGTLYEFLRNDKLAANNFFANRAGSAKTPYKRNQFGGTLGGRIIRDKTFFFASFEGRRGRIGEVNTSTVPLPAAKRGDFNGQGLLPIYDPASTRQEGTRWVRDPYPGNVIPRSQFDPVGSKVASWFPDPTMPGLTRNFFYSPVNIADNDQYDGRLDHVFSGSHRGFLRYSRRDYRNLDPGPLPLPADGGMWTTVDLLATSYVANFNSVLSPTFNNEFRFGFTRADSLMDIPWTLNNKDLGMLSLPDFGRDNDHGVTRFVATNYTDLGSRSFWPNTNFQDVYHISEQVVSIRGRHFVKAGFEFRKERIYRRAARYARGVMNFNGSFTQDPNNRGRTGDSLADMLLGMTNNGTLSNIQGEDIRTRNYALYLQDDIKLLPRLTLNLGVRWDRFGIPSFGSLQKLPVNRIILGPPGSSDVQILRPKDEHDCGGRHANKNFAPRLGFAYQLRRTTVIRSGFGIYYGANEIASNSAVWRSGPPDYAEFTFQTPDRLLQPGLIVSRGFPTDLFPVTTVARNLSIQTSPTYRPTQYAMQWFFDIQRQLPQNVLLTVSYIGAGSRQGQWNRNLNAVGAGAGSIASRRPWPYFNDINYYQSGGNTSYNGLAVKAERRFSRGLTFLTSYTWSHMLDDGAGALGEGGTWRNPHEIRWDRASANYDRRHNLVSSFVYNLPFGRREKWGRSWNRVVDGALGGWQLGGILTFRSGRLFSVTVSGNPANSDGTNYADRLRHGALPADQRSIDRWFDLTAFAVPAQYTYGNGGRNILSSPRFSNQDLKISKNFRVRERTRAELRLEMFNFTNHPNFGKPNSVLQNVEAGKINSASSPRIIQLGVRLSY